MMDDQQAVIEALHTVYKAGDTAVLVTVITTEGSIPRHPGSKLLVYADGRTVGTVGGGEMESRVIEAAREVLRTGSPRLETYTLNDIAAGDAGICGGTITVFIEVLGVATRLLVIGAGHCGVELAQLGKWMGYHVTLVDDRPEYCNAEHVPGLDRYIVCEPEAVTEHVTVDHNTYVAALTRGLPVDVKLLPTLLETDAPYIGLIGSKRRWTLTAKTLREEHGIVSESLARIRSPIGLELEAETPREIAVSIIAEIIMTQRGSTGKPMQAQQTMMQQQD